MPIEVTCPNPDCGKVYSLPDDRAGKTGRCSCGTLLKVSGAGPAAPPVPPAPAPPSAAAPTPQEPPDAGALQPGEILCPHCQMPTPRGVACTWCHRPVAVELPPPPPPAPIPTSKPRPPTPAMPLAGELPSARDLREHRLGSDQAILLGVDVVSAGKTLACINLILFMMVAGVTVMLSAVLHQEVPGVGLMGLAATLPLGAVAMLVSGFLVPIFFNLVSGWLGGLPVRFGESLELRVSGYELTYISPIPALIAGALAGAVLGVLSAFQAMMSGSSSAMGISVALVPFMDAAGLGLGGLLFAALYNALTSLWGGTKVYLG